MKILLVIDQFFSANNGMTISARRFAQRLSLHGHEVRIVSTGSEGDTEYLMKKQYIPVFDRLVASQGMTFAKTDCDILYRAVGWADVVHILVPFALSHHAIEIAQELHVPYTAAFHVQPENITSSIHMQKLTFVNNAIYRWFNYYVYQYCTHIHCPSNFIANELKRSGYTAKLHVISNGIDPDFVYKKSEKPAELADKFCILNVGRLSVEKRQDVLIKAAAKSKYRDRLQIMLAGQGPRREAYEKLAKSLNVPVRFGFYTKDKLIELISQCDLYAHTADAEIEAMSCMEAFAGGLVPVIANSKKSATPQFALDERCLFTAGSPDSLAEKIDFWIENEALRREYEVKYGELGKEYNLDECVRKAEQMFWEAIYENRGTRAEDDEYEYTAQIKHI